MALPKKGRWPCLRNEDDLALKGRWSFPKINIFWVLDFDQLLQPNLTSTYPQVGVTLFLLSTRDNINYNIVLEWKLMRKLVVCSLCDIFIWGLCKVVTEWLPQISKLCQKSYCEKFERNWLRNGWDMAPTVQLSFTLYDLLSTHIS